MARTSKYTYYPSATIKDELDGSVYTLGMTSEALSIEISGNTHPFYTGQETLVDTAGRIDKFKAKQAKANSATKSDKKTKSRKTKMTLTELMKDNEAKPEVAPKVKKAKPTPVATEEITTETTPEVKENSEATPE